MTAQPKMYNKVRPKRCSFRFTIQVEVKVTSEADLAALELSDSRIVLLYSTRQEVISKPSFNP